MYNHFNSFQAVYMFIKLKSCGHSRDFLPFHSFLVFLFSVLHIYQYSFWSFKYEKDLYVSDLHIDAEKVMWILTSIWKFPKVGMSMLIKKGYF